MISSSSILIGAIIAGALLGHFSPAVSEWLSTLVDYTLLTLVGLLFLGVRLDALFQVFKNIQFIVIAVLANFIIIPILGYGIASLFLSEQPFFFVGLVIYFMSPCTDWFLSFTRLSRGNVLLGTALIPINMALQLLLYPFYLQWFTQNSVSIELMTLSNTLLQWFLLPLLLALVAHQVLRRLLLPLMSTRVLNLADRTSLWVTALLVLQLFAGNISVIVLHTSVVVWVVMAALCFFVITYLFGGVLSRIFRLDYPERALLCMTMASRNAPLMLAITMVALPEQPLIYAGLVIGMLVEIPHLTALRYVLLKHRNFRRGQETLRNTIEQA